MNTTLVAGIQNIKWRNNILKANKSLKKKKKKLRGVNSSASVKMKNNVWDMNMNWTVLLVEDAEESSRSVWRMQTLPGYCIL